MSYILLELGDTEKQVYSLPQESQRRIIDELLVNGAQGFTYTGDQDRYDECEAAINEVLKTIKRFGQKIKVGGVHQNLHGLLMKR